MNEDRENQLLLLTAALFAVRLFREADSVLPADIVRRPLDREWVIENQARLRAEAAERSALDAAAIMAAVDKISST
jgi:hypothetical protein